MIVTNALYTEIDAYYFQAAKERLERHQRQETLPLNEPRPIPSTASLSEAL